MLSMNQIAEAIESEGRTIGKLADDIVDIARTAAETEADYKVEFAKARLIKRDACAAVGKKVTMDEVEDHATLEAAGSRRAYLLAQGSLTAARDALRASQARLDALRTLAATYRGAGA